MADANFQFGLSRDAGFLGRLSALMVQIAKEKFDADDTDAYAKKVLKNSFSAAQDAVMFLLQADNFVGQTISWVPLGSGGAYVIATADADARSQISTIWSDLTLLFG